MCRSRDRTSRSSTVTEPPVDVGPPPGEPAATRTSRPLRPAFYPGCPATVTSALAAGTPLRPTGWGLRDGFLALIGSWALIFLFVFWVAIVQAVGGTVPGWVLLIGGTVAPWLAMAGWPWFATRRWGNGPRIDLGLGFDGIDVAWGVIGGLVALVAGVAVAALTELLFGSFESAAGEAAADLVESGAQWEIFVFAAVVAVGAPFVEELLFRGMFWAGLTRLGASRWLALLVTSLLFSLFHFEPVRIAVLFVVGLVVGVLRMITGRLAAPMIAHGVNNLPGALQMLTL